jgi:hypothetical protein
MMKKAREIYILFTGLLASGYLLYNNSAEKRVSL